MYKDHRHDPGDPEKTKTLSEHAVIRVRNAKAHTKARTHLDFHLVQDMKSNKKGFQTYKGQESGFIKYKMYLISLMASHKELTGLVDERRAAGIFYSDIRKVFDTVSHYVLMNRLMKYGPDKNGQ